MNVLFAASEITPIIKSGGLADVVGALPKHLSALGVDVRVIIPDYPQLNPGVVGATQSIASFDLALEQRTIQVTIRQAKLPGTEIKIYLLGLSQGLTTPTLYPAPKEGNQDRFPLFCQAVLQWLQTAEWQPEVIHVHDWMTGLLPYLIHQRNLPYKTVITIHNLAYQGVTARENLLSADITPPSSAKIINLLKTGILFATKVNTVSPTYAKEVMTRQYGYHLEATMRQRARDFSGILNGVDYSRYAPYADKTLHQDYTMKTAIESKIINKEMLRKEVGLKSDKRKPLFGMVTRIDDQKGLNLVESLIRETPFMEHAQLVILGTGSKELERKFARLAKKHPGQLALLLRFDEGLAHRIYASSDFFMVPSKFEPCGLSQMISMKYGTLPIVRYTGGLADTVTDVTDNPSKGTGFVFKDFDHLALSKATNHALSLFNDKPALYATIEQAMRQDFSWGKSARDYVELYQATLKARHQLKPKSKSKTKS
jgi:starch synthase